jgi:hypothetical protein
MRGRPPKRSPLVVDRSALTERVLLYAPALLLITAPAGYGKTRFARLVSARLGGGVTCDVTGVDTPPQLAQKIVLAMLAGGAVGDGLAQTAAMMSTADRSDEWDHLVEALWLREGGPACVVFDNAERIAQYTELTDRIAGLAVLQSERRLIVCSRTRFDSTILRRMPPNEILHVGVRDLEFSPQETRGLLLAARAPKELIPEAIDQSRGWPIAALLFARAAQAGELRQALQRAEAAENVTAYVLSQAFENLDTPTVELLGAIAHISPATEADLRAFGTTAEHVRFIAREHPFFVEENGSIIVHPLAQKALVDEGHGKAVLLEVARRCESSEPLLAARLFVVAGKHDDAARLLGAALAPLMMGEVPLLLAEVVSAIGKDVLLRHPGAWASTTVLHAFTRTSEERLDEARIVWRSLADDCPIPLRVSIASAYYQHAQFLGNVDEATELFTSLERSLASEPPDSPWRAVVDFYRNWGELRTGKLVDVAAIRSRSQALLAVPSTHAAFQWEFEARVAIMLLQRDVARQHLEIAVELARSTDTMLFRVIVLLAAAFFAWFAGENELYERYLTMLREDSTPAMSGGTSYFLECCLENPVTATPRNEFRYQRAFAAVIGASRCFVAHERQQLAEIAVSAATDDGQPLLLTMAWLSLAFVSPSRRDEALTNAMMNARRMDGGAWISAIEQLTLGEGPLVAFRNRFLEDAANPQTKYIRISLITGTVRVKDKNIALSGREYELLVFLALREGSVSAEFVSESLWPESDGDRARSALRVTISRLRAHLGDPSLIITAPNALTLSADRELDIGPYLKRDGIRSPQYIPSDAELEAARERFSRWPWARIFEDRLRELEASRFHPRVPPPRTTLP